MKIKKIASPAAALLLSAARRSPIGATSATPNEPPYLTMPVSRGKCAQVVSSTGTLQAVVTVQVGSQVSGTHRQASRRFQYQGERRAGRRPARIRTIQGGGGSGARQFAGGASEHREEKVSVEDAERTLERTQRAAQARA